MTSGRGFSEDMRLAHVLADQADSISMERFKAQDLQVETKPDLTPVTDADRAVEEQLRITLSRARTRAAGSRTTCQAVTGQRETSPTPYVGCPSCSSSVAGRQLAPGVPTMAGTNRQCSAPSARATMSGSQVSVTASLSS